MDAPTLPACAGETPVAELAHAYLSARFGELCGFESLAREGTDPEGVHQMRVTTRRLRAVLPMVKGVLPKAVRKELAAELSWLGDALGDVRDLDVQIAGLREARDRSRPVHAFVGELETMQDEARGDLLECLDSARFASLKLEFGELLDALITPPDSPTVAAAARSFIARDPVAVCKLCNRALASRRDRDLHKLRKRLKRMRYACEFFVPAYSGRLPRFVKKVGRLLAKLGDFNDACVARHAIEEHIEARGHSSKSLRKLADARNRERKSQREQLLDKELPRLLHRLRPAKLDEMFGGEG